MKITSFFRREAGAATIIEYVIVLPIVLLIVLFMFTVGFFLNQQALLDSAAERGLFLAQKLYTDPNAESILDAEYGQAFKSAGYQIKQASGGYSYNYDPYRYWGDYKVEEIGSAVRQYVEGVVKKGQSGYIGLFLGDPVADYTPESGLLTKNVTITVRQRFRIFPTLANMLWGKQEAALLGSATMTVNAQTEFVRNVDFAADLLGRFKVVDTVIDRIAAVLDKVTAFFTKK